MTNNKIVQILYVNWKRETAWRQIEPIEIWFGHTQWHLKDQWLLKARDIEKTSSGFCYEYIKNGHSIQARHV